MIGKLVALALRREARSRDVLATLLVVGALVVVVGDLAFHDLPARAEVVAGTLWLGATFAAALAFARGASAESEESRLDTLLALPVARPAVYVAEAAANAVLLAGVVVALLVLHAAVAGDALRPTDAVALPVVVLGVVGLSATATLLAAVAARTRGRAAMLPVLLLPVVVPVLVAALHGTADALAGGGWHDVEREVMLLAGYDVAVLAVAALVFEEAVEG